VLVVGADERAQGTVTLKDLEIGEQSSVPRAMIVEELSRRSAGKN
jgi:histidyl-tRNA synthetase